MFLMTTNFTKYSLTKFPMRGCFFLIKDRIFFSENVLLYIHMWNLQMLSDASRPHMFASVGNRQICVFLWLSSVFLQKAKKNPFTIQEICGLTMWKWLGVTSDGLLHLSAVDLRGLIVLHWFTIFHIFHIWMPGIVNTPCSSYLTDNCALSPQLFSFLAFFNCLDSAASPV